MRISMKRLGIVAAVFVVLLTGAPTNGTQPGAHFPWPGPNGTPVKGYVRNSCEDYPFTVVCGKIGAQKGGWYCFDTLCDARAAGATQCRANLSACEPH